MLSETEINKIREEAEKKYDEFFGTGYWEEQYKKHIVEFTKQFAQEKLNDERERAKELIEAFGDVDFTLTMMEDYIHGSDGVKITQMRRQIQEALNTYDKTINNGEAY